MVLHILFNKSNKTRDEYGVENKYTFICFSDLMASSAYTSYVFSKAMIDGKIQEIRTDRLYGCI